MRYKTHRYGFVAAMAGLFAVAVLLPSALAGDGTDKTAKKGPDPYEKADESWISISGKVTSVSADAFTLDYGDGIVTVEMDDGDRDADGYKLMKGDEVTVSGRIDDDFFESTTIEANSVYVDDLGTYFFASSLDEEDVFVTHWTPIVPSHAVVQGTVTDVDEHEFTLHTGMRALRVDVQELDYDPLDDKGYQQIDVGDRVSVAGTIEAKLFEGRELTADSIVTLKSADS